jgi:putative ABC transport system substrate-binding protein
MRRRQFITLLAGAATWPLVAGAQQPGRTRLIGVLSGLAEGDSEGQARIAEFQNGLQRLGWKDGGNVRIEYRWAGGDTARLRGYAAELVGLKPDVILAAAGSALAPLRRNTSTIPIVFAQVADPLGAGIVASLARPGGNVTGFATAEYGLAVKWLELLKQIAPSITRVAVIHQPGLPQTAGLLQEIEAGALALDVELSTVAVRNYGEAEQGIATFARKPNGGLIIPPSPLIATHRDRIIAFASQQRLPVVYPYRFFVTSGGLASYGIDNHDLYRRAASYVDRILKGERPGDLPVQLPTKYELVINLKAAKALGLEVPIALLSRADELVD